MGEFEEVAKLKGTRLNGVFFAEQGVPVGPGLIVEADEAARTITIKHDSGKVETVQFQPVEAAEK